MSHFRFQDFTIWNNAIEVTDELFDWTDMLETDKKFRSAEQLRGAVMSITNNIRGCSIRLKERFCSVLSYSRKSCCETANILILLERRDYLATKVLKHKLEEIEILSKMITNFKKSLLKK